LNRFKPTWDIGFLSFFNSLLSSSNLPGLKSFLVFLVPEVSMTADLPRTGFRTSTPSTCRRGWAIPSECSFTPFHPPCMNVGKSPRSFLLLEPFPFPPPSSPEVVCFSLFPSDFPFPPLGEVHQSGIYGSPSFYSIENRLSSCLPHRWGQVTFLLPLFFFSCSVRLVIEFETSCSSCLFSFSSHPVVVFFASSSPILPPPHRAP